MKKIYFILFFSVLALFSCKDSDRDNDTTVNSCDAYGAGQSYALDVFKMVHQAALSSKGITSVNLADTTTLFGCDTLIVDTTSNPMTITIRFNGICMENGNEKSGEIMATFSGKYDYLSTVVNVSFSNYIFNGYPISGTLAYNFQGIVNGNPTYGITTTEYALENSKQRMLKFSGSQQLAITAGETTATVSDDTYSISGSATGRTFEGNDYNVLIDENLVLKGNCNWISSGTATVSPENKHPRLLNFGSSCDNNGTAQIYGLSYEVVFP